MFSGGGGVRASVLAPPHCSRCKSAAVCHEAVSVPCREFLARPPPSDVASLSNAPTEPLLRNPAAFFATFPSLKPQKNPLKMCV